MGTLLNPYLSFKDDARQAMEFYKSVFGGKLELHTFKEYHAAETPDEDDRIMHAMLETKDFKFMASDTPNRMDFDPGARISMSLSGSNGEELEGYFNKLAEGGQITIPLEQQVWGDKFGMLADKFGVKWMVNISAQPQDKKED